jgi:hypothetical protein
MTVWEQDVCHTWWSAKLGSLRAKSHFLSGIYLSVSFPFLSNLDKFSLAGLNHWRFHDVPANANDQYYLRW